MKSSKETFSFFFTSDMQALGMDRPALEVEHVNNSIGKICHAPDLLDEPDIMDEEGDE